MVLVVITVYKSHDIDQQQITRLFSKISRVFLKITRLFSCILMIDFVSL